MTKLRLQKVGGVPDEESLNSSFLADQLKACKNCTKPIYLHNISREQRVGYASILYIPCECGSENSVATGKSHRPENKSRRGMPVYDINTKAVLGVFHSGLTYRQINGFMATIEVKGLHHSSMMRRQEEIQPHIQHVAEESCSSILQEEMQNERSNTNNSDNDDSTHGTFKYDMGWQKRGSGRAYDSKSGVGTLMGNKTNRICAYGVRIADCRTCQRHQLKGDTETIPRHNCAKNWSGSSKGMESDVGVDLIKSVEMQGAKVKTIIMDDDTTTMAKIRSELDHEVNKWSDKNHTSKHLTNSLFKLQQKHKSLSNTVIAYLKKCFNYALAQTEGDVESCRQQIEQIVPHAFGNHNDCGEWCGFHKNPDSYKHGTINKDLSGEDLHRDLTSVFRVFSLNAEKIAPGGSTKEIESFNNMIASKAPKRCHFSSTGNILSRVGCAVAQKNLGNGYINKINEKLGLSPGHIYKREALLRDTERKRQKIYSNKKETKLRKIKNKVKKRLVMNAKESKEGITYKSAVAVTHHADHSSIPSMKQPPTLEKIQNSDNIKFVFCDIETGSLTKSADILQISACQDGQVFNQYILPTQPISSASSKVTKLTSQGQVLFFDGFLVSAVHLRDALNLFIVWLKSFDKVVLVGHNFKVFDFPRLLRAFQKEDLQSNFEDVCIGGVDTLSLFREIHPDMEKYSQEHLIKTIMNMEYQAHNAVDDVTSLEKLFKFTNLPNETCLKHSFTTKWGLDNMSFLNEVASNAETFSCLLRKKVISTSMINKIARSGLSFNHLLSVFQSNGKCGLQHLLGEKVGGVTRVTSNSKVLDSLTNYFESVDIYVENI